jgi:hypothetical protein
MPPEQVAPNGRAIRKVDQRKTLVIDRTQNVQVFWPNEEQIPGFDPLALTVYGVLTHATLDPAYLRKIMSMKLGGPPRQEENDRQMMGLVGSDELLPTLALNHINITR